MKLYLFNKKHCIIVLIISFFTLNPVQAAPFRQDSLYSKWVIDSRMSDFRNKGKTEHFLTPSSERNLSWDYVPGLVAKAIVKAWDQYSNKAWSKYWLTGIMDYADNTEMHLGESNIDDLNAAKIFFELYRAAKLSGDTEKAALYREKATICRNKLKYEHSRIDSNLPGAGGFWHKKQYINQMWLDGLYMGAAFYGEWQGYFGKSESKKLQKESWNDIALQFDTVFKHTWDKQKRLNYHAWSAEPNNKASRNWADPLTGQSAEFWARGEGWFFAALVDVLEFMPKNHPARQRLIGYTQQVAEGVKDRQDKKSGVWYQLLQYDSSLKGTNCEISNYLESSASSMFTYSYFKAIRLGILSKKKYQPVAEKAYQGLIENFVEEEANGKIKLLHSCESAGLSATRKGDADYYLCGSDVAIHNDTEGKVLGPFIMASLEYEKFKLKNLKKLKICKK